MTDSPDVNLDTIPNPQEAEVNKYYVSLPLSTEEKERLNEELEISYLAKPGECDNTFFCDRPRAQVEQTLKKLLPNIRLLD